LAVSGRGAAALRVLVRLVVAVVLLAPLGFMVSGSLRRVGLPPPRGVELVPEGAGLTAFRELGELLPLGRLLLNSLAVVVVAVPVTVLVASAAGFALAQLPRRFRRLLVGTTVALLLIPLPMLWVARFALYLRLGVLDTLVPLMAPALAATTPFTVLLAYRSFRRVPPDLFAAARLDGASALRTWWSVGLPLTRATTTAIAAIAFAFHWGNYLDALLYVRSPDDRTLALGVGELTQLDPGDFPVYLAGAVLLAVPPLLALLAAQRPLLGSVDLAVDR
jgi:multiple sugar transport system permease protein